MKKLLTVLLTVMMAFTVCTVNVLADDAELPEETIVDRDGDNTIEVTVTVGTPTVGTTKIKEISISAKEGKNKDVELLAGPAEGVKWQKWDTTTSKWVDGPSSGADPESVVAEAKYRLAQIGLNGGNSWKDKPVKVSIGEKTFDVTANGEGKAVVKVAGGSESSATTYLYLLNLEKISVDIPEAVTGLIYNGNEQTGVADPALDAPYTITGNKATDAGDHTATATLKDTSTHVWEDGLTAAKNITFTIGQATIDSVEFKSGKGSYRKGTFPVKDDLVVKANDVTLNSSEFTLEGADSTIEGENTLTVKAVTGGNFKDANTPVTIDYTVYDVKDIEINSEDVEVTDLTYTGWNQQANVKGLSAAEEKHIWYTEKHYTVTYEQKQKVEANKAGLAADEKKPEPKDEWVAVDNCKDAGDYKAIITLDEGYKFVKAEPNKAGLPTDEKKPPKAPEDPKRKLSEDGKTLTIEFKVNKAPVFVYLQNDSVEAKLDKDGNLVKQEPVVRTWTNTYTRPELDIKFEGKGDTTKIGKYNVNVKLKGEDKAPINKNFYLVEIDKDGNYAKDKEGNYKKANEVKLAYEITKIYARATLKNAYVRWNGEDQQPTVLINGKALDERYFKVSEGEYVDVASYKVTVTLKHPGNVYTFDKEVKHPATQTVELTYNIIKANLPQVQLYNNDNRGYVANLDSDCEMQITNLDAYDGEEIKLEVWDRGWKEVEEFDYDEDGNFKVEAGTYRITAVGCEHHNDTTPTLFTVRTATNEDGEAYSIADKKVPVKTKEVTMVCDYDYEEYSVTNPWTGREIYSWNNLKKVTVDGEEIDILSVVSNSTDVTFATKTLAVGTHEVSFHYENGMHVEGKLIVYNNNNYVAPKTGC